MLYTKRSISMPLVSPDLAQKVGWLRQAPCVTCTPADVRPLAIGFPIRARPFSAQSLGASRFADLKVKIAAYMAGRKWELDEWAGLELCVTIVATVPERERGKDVDNMAKGLLDAMQGSIYANDNLVQHLSIRRVPHGGETGWYSMRVMPVRDTREDVIDKLLSVGWAGQAEIVADV